MQVRMNSQRLGIKRRKKRFQFLANKIVPELWLSLRIQLLVDVTLHCCWTIPSSTLINWSQEPICWSRFCCSYQLIHRFALQLFSFLSTHLFLSFAFDLAAENYALLFPRKGTSDYVITRGMPSLKAVTFCLWVKSSEKMRERH